MFFCLGGELYLSTSEIKLFYSVVKTLKQNDF